MSRLRVVNLGLPKSGTTTLARAMKTAGLKTADHRIRRRQTANAALHKAYVGQLIYGSYFQTGDPLAQMDEFDAFTEINLLKDQQSLWPQCDWGVIDAIRRHHPGVKFLASYRDPQAISDSMLRWSNLGTERLPKNTIPGLPQGFGGSNEERLRWITAHYAFLQRVFAGDDSFLQYDVADRDARAKISSFLGIELKWWGRANRNRSKPKPNPKIESKAGTTPKENGTEAA